MLVVKEENYKEFFARLKQATHIPLQFRAFMAVTMWAGMRVSEGLDLRPANFITKDTLEFKVSKRPEIVTNRDGKELEAHQETRKVVVDDSVLALLEEWKQQRKFFTANKHFSKFFSYTRRQIDHLCKKYFGEGACHHSIARHSRISYLLFKQDMPAVKVSSLMKMRIDTVDKYAHTDDEKEWNKIKERS
jgi:integrase